VTRFPRPRLLVLLAVAEFMLTLDLSIVNVALPAIRDDLGFDTASLQWVINAYAVTFAGFLLMGGRAADLLGGRRVFLSAVAVFDLASFACGMAPNVPFLVAARAVQGLSAGVLAPTTLSVLTATYEQPDVRSRALSVWSAVAIGGGAAGGLLGGVLISALSWRWVFFINVPVGLWLWAAGRRHVPARSWAAPGERLDVIGAITATGGIFALVWALAQSSAVGWAAGPVLGAFVLAGALLTMFALVEARLARSPLVPLSVFSSRPIWAGNLLSFLSFVPVTATWFILTVYLQRIRELSPLQTGALFIPLSLAVIAGSQAGFHALRTVSARTLLLTGGLTAAVGLGWLAHLTTNTPLTWLIVPGSMTMVGGGLMFAPVTAAATSAAPEHSGLASGLLNATRQIGGALGLALLTSIAAGATGSDHRSPVALTSGYAAALIAGAAVFAGTALGGALVLPRRLGDVGLDPTTDRTSQHGPAAEPGTEEENVRLHRQRAGRPRG
jgi:EmrB/QacA subfamily drug resistance transporter